MYYYIMEPVLLKKRRGKSALEKSVKVYGNVAITDCITEGVTKEFPINLEYYKIRKTKINHMELA